MHFRAMFNKSAVFTMHSLNKKEKGSDNGIVKPARVPDHWTTQGVAKESTKLQLDNFLQIKISCHDNNPVYSTFNNCFFGL